jgi:hypothetical protein
MYTIDWNHTPFLKLQSWQEAVQSPLQTYLDNSLSFRSQRYLLVADMCAAQCIEALDH